MGENTKPEVFIIESLTFADERNERTEGRVISQILALSDKKCQYYYIRTKRELGVVLKKFSTSEYRYLHLSCHGNSHSMATTLDDINFSTLGKILRPHLSERRLFVSACSMTNDALAKELMHGSGCYSILGPAQDVGFADAAILWASLYHVMFSQDEKRIRRAVLKAKAQEVANMFRAKLCFIGQDDSPRGYVIKRIKPKPSLE